MGSEQCDVLGLDVDDVDNGGAASGKGDKTGEKALNHRCSKGVEDVEDDRREGDGKLKGVGGEDVEIRAGPSRGLPDGEIPACSGGEGGVELHAEGLAEGECRGEHDGAAFSAAYIDERVVRKGRGANAALPMLEGAVEEGRRCTGIGGVEAVIGVARVETHATDETAGVDMVFKIERIRGKADWERDAVNASAHMAKCIHETALTEQSMDTR